MSPAALTEQVRAWMKYNHYRLDEELGSSTTTTSQFDEAVAALDALAEALAQTEKERDARELQLANITAYCSQRQFPVPSEVIRLAAYDVAAGRGGGQ